MIARKAIELQRQLPQSSGYLQSQQSMGANPGQITQPANPAYPGGPPADEQAKVNADYAKRLAAAKQKQKVPNGSYDPRTQSESYNANIAAVGKMGAKDAKSRKQGYLDQQQLLTNRPDRLTFPTQGAPTGEPVAFDEAGRPIYAQPEPPMPLAGQHQNQMILPPGDVAISERGMPLDRSGKPTGYLDTLGARPNAPGPGELQFADRRPGDLSLDADKIKRDPLARAQLDQQYGQHLRAKDAGETSFPSYLKMLKHQDGSPYSKDERDNVKQGVKVLREVQNLEDGTKLTST